MESKVSSPFHQALLVVILVVAAVGGCDRSPARSYLPQFAQDDPDRSTTPAYSFGVFPLHNPVRLFEVYGPVIDTVNSAQKQLAESRPAAFILKLEASRDYSSYEAKLREQKLQFAIVNPYQAVLAEKSGHYRIFGKMGNDDLMRVIILVRKDSGIDSISDLRGQTIGLPAPTAMAASLMNKVHLRQHGLDIEKEARVTYVNSQDSAVMNVFLGLTKAGGTWPPTWIKIKREKPEVGRALKVLTQTDPLPNLAIVVRTDVPEGHAREVARNLFNMGKTQQGESILKSLETPGFETADSRTYAPVRRFLEMYERLFGSLPQPSRQQAAGIQAPSVSR